MKTGKLKIFLIVAAIAAIWACKEDDDDKEPGPEGKNKSVISDITYSNTAEMEMGKVAYDKAVSQVVKTYALSMISEHRIAQGDLDTIARNRNIGTPRDMLPNHRATLDSISMLSGSQFDSAYMLSQIRAHTNTMNMFTAFNDSTSDDDLKSYVERYIPKVEMHLTRADSIFNAIRLTK